MDEESFHRAILDSAKDDASLLVYADWLEERGDRVSTAKAEFLRLTVELTDKAEGRRRRKSRRKRLQQLAAALDPDCLAVVSRLPVENCFRKRTDEAARRALPLRFDFLCDRRWEDLRTTEDQGRRFCDDCKQHVHYCDTIGEAREHAWAGHCIAVDLGVIRREDDLHPRRMWLGMPSVETLRKEEERMQPDPVSAERERQQARVVRERPLGCEMGRASGTATAQLPGTRPRQAIPVLLLTPAAPG
jgi:uncharacterized protein (TIGR02996 family)